MGMGFTRRVLAVRGCADDVRRGYANARVPCVRGDVHARAVP